MKKRSRARFAALLVAALLGPLLVVATPAPASAQSIEVVWHGGAFGPGSFRDAVRTANSDDSVSRIVVMPYVETIDAWFPVVYTGNQDLTINGAGATLTARPWVFGDLFSTTSTESLTIRNMDFTGAMRGSGINVFAPLLGLGDVEVVLDGVGVYDNADHGVHIDDTIGTVRGVSLTVKNSSIVGNGSEGLDTDFDGLRVDERGLGSITADITNSAFDENEADGLELDEAGIGDVVLTVDESSFDDNGPGNPDDLDDGLDIDEAGPGDIDVTIDDSTIDGNFDEGLDLDEADGGDLRLVFEDSTANGNMDQGVKTTESGAGDSNVTFRRSEAVGNGGDGLEAEEDDDDDGAIEPGGGQNFVTVSGDSALTDNGENGIEVDEDSDGSILTLDGGALTVGPNVDLFGNTDGPYDSDVIIIDLG